MKTRRIAAVCATVVLAASVGIVPAAAQPSAVQKEKLQATEVGVSATEIRVAVVADVDNALSPGLFQASPDAVEAFAKYINKNGGLAGRKLVVDFIDSKLNADESRNAIIKACSEDFAIVGTAALFLTNVDDLVGCVDKAGEATGIPDLPIVTTEIAQQCSEVSFPVNAPQIDCTTKDATPQTFRANQGPINYYERTTKQDLHGIFTIPNDLKAAAVGGFTLARGAQAAGVTSDGENPLSSRSPQSSFTPFIQQMKDASSNYALNTGPFILMSNLRREAKLQGLTNDDIVWDCFSNCYDVRLMEVGGADVEGQFVTLAQVPFEEARHNKALANYIKFAGKDKVNGYGSYAWVASLLFRDAVNAVVAERGNNGLTRAALLTAIEGMHDFDADGMWGTTDIGNKVPTPCFMITQVHDGKFQRVYPKKAASFDCKKSNGIEIEEDLLGSG